MIQESIHPCGKTNLGARSILKWIADHVTSTPLKAALKNNVRAIKYVKDLEGMHFILMADTEVAARGIRRNLDLFTQYLRDGYMRESEIEIVSVGVEVFQ